MLKRLSQIKKYTINNKYLLTLTKSDQLRNLNDFENIYSLSVAISFSNKMSLLSSVRFSSFSASSARRLVIPVSDWRS